MGNRLLACVLLFAAGMCAGETPRLRIPRVTQAPTLEHYLSGAGRPDEVRVTGFRQREPGDGTPVSQETAAYVSYDDKNLYVIFVCRDDPAQVRARMAKRESFMDGDDFVAVLLDTFHDHHRAYAFITNPLGIQMDGVVTEGQNDDYSFDTLWHSEGRLTDYGYVVWMALPFKSLRFSSDSVQTWGISLARSIARNNETSFWPYMTRKIASFTRQMADLEGLRDISPGRNLQFIPYAAASAARFLDRAASAYKTDSDARAGLDAKLVLRDALTVDLALNPDFSQVESDEPQVLINQRFEVFFPEKRPFFLENAGFFQTQETLFFSRRIGDPQFGARMTGKLGHWALGALVTDDRAPGRQAAPGSPWHGERAAIGVFSARREFARQSSVGVLVTSRDFGPAFNRVASLDARFLLSKNWVLTGQAVRSYDRDLAGVRRSGPEYIANLSYSSRRVGYSSSYTDRSPDFRANALGFISRVDIRQTEHFARYLWFPKRKGLVNFGPKTFMMANWDRRGRLQDWKTDTGLTMEFKRQTQLSVERAESFELFQEKGFRKHYTWYDFSTSWLKWLQFSSYLVKGTGVNYHPGTGFRPPDPLPPFLARFTEGKLGLTIRPAPRLRLDETYLYSRLGAGAVHLPGIAGSPAIFNNHIVRSKVNYQFSRRLSLRAILDYSAVLANPLLVDQERTKRLSGDVLLTYLVNPGTALYIGYTDGYENLALEGAPPSLRRTVAPTTSTGRQFFVKLSYLFRF
jgi:hypothetical protein